MFFRVTGNYLENGTNYRLGFSSIVEANSVSDAETVAKIAIDRDADIYCISHVGRSLKESVEKIENREMMMAKNREVMMAKKQKQEWL